MVFQGLEQGRVDRKPRNWAPSVPVGGVIQGLKYVSRGFGTSIFFAKNRGFEVIFGPFCGKNGPRQVHLGAQNAFLGGFDG